MDGRRDRRFDHRIDLDQRRGIILDSRSAMTSIVVFFDR
jgi:hypothetical protein